MKWIPEYSTGSKEIDDQHRSLFAYADEFRETLENDGGQKTYDLFLEFLNAYVEYHFGFEEDCMHAHSCPAACQNKKEHGGFTQVVA